MYSQEEKDKMAMKNDAIDKFTQLKYRNDGSIKKFKEISLSGNSKCCVHSISVSDCDKPTLLQLEASK